MKSRPLVYWLAGLFVISSAVVVIGQETKTKKASAAVPACSLNHEPGYIKAWTGQPGTPDHSDSVFIKQGDWMGCFALAALNSPVPPGCFLQYQNDGGYTLASRTAMNSPHADTVYLSCNGQAPTCCKVQTVDADKALDKSQVTLKLVKPEDAAAAKKP